MLEIETSSCSALLLTISGRINLHPRSVEQFALQWKSGLKCSGTETITVGTTKALSALLREKGEHIYMCWTESLLWPDVSNKKIFHLPFSTWASLCMRGSHTRHWGGGSAINVSKNMFSMIFFCKEKRNRT